MDTSAIMAILKGEPEASRFGDAMVEAEGVAISAATLMEAGMVAESRGGAAARHKLDQLIAEIGAEVVPFTEEHLSFALDGWRRFGKGRHPAALNLGDCFAYGLAQSRSEPLLFKGNDFSRTDVRRAV